MRFLVSEKSYESIVAGGVYVYSSGAKEAWRVSQVHDGEQFFHIVRVDLETERWSALYHVISRGDGVLDRIVYRFLPEKNRGQDLEEKKITGNVVFESSSATNLREIDGVRREGEVVGSGGEGAPFVLFPSTVGLGWMLRAQSLESVAVLDRNDQFGIKTIKPAVSKSERADHVVVGRHEIEATSHVITFGNQIRIIWLDQHQFPVKMVRPMPNDQAVEATESRYIRYN